MSNVIDFAESAMAIVHRSAPCPEASILAEQMGHSPMIFEGGTPSLLHHIKPSTFDRFKAVQLALTQSAGHEYAEAIAWVNLDCVGVDALAAVYHEVLGIPPLGKPLMMVGSDMTVALSTCDLFEADEEDMT